MSYSRGEYYIYPTGEGGVEFVCPNDRLYITDSALNVWLASLAERGDELDRRIAHGKEVLAGSEEPFVLWPKIKRDNK